MLDPDHTAKQPAQQCIVVCIFLRTNKLGQYAHHAEAGGLTQSIYAIARMAVYMHACIYRQMSACLRMHEKQLYGYVSPGVQSKSADAWISHPCYGCGASAQTNANGQRSPKLLMY